VPNKGVALGAIDCVCTGPERGLGASGMCVEAARAGGSGCYAGHVAQWRAEVQGAKGAEWVRKGSRDAEGAGGWQGHQEGTGRAVWAGAGCGLERGGGVALVGVMESPRLGKRGLGKGSRLGDYIFG
jgi:hypothetical protein